MSVTEGLEPKAVFGYFEEISRIPRGSGNMEGIREYIESFAEAHNLECTGDEAGNLLLRKAASAGYEDHGTVLLQAHMDMVCVKKTESAHDFLTDPIELVLEGDILCAKDTTLGADDGIGCAYMLAILADDAIPHPPLECLFTADEEVGLKGAEQFDPSVLRARKLINLDTGREGTLIVGCAGGMTETAVFPVTRHRLKGILTEIRISGLVGGHSGGRIQTPAANAIRIMARLADELRDAFPIAVCALDGGEKHNSIPVNASLMVLADNDDLADMDAYVKQFGADLRRELRGYDDAVCLELEGVEIGTFDVIDEACTDALIGYLLTAPHGVERMNPEVPGIAETSCNLATVATTDETMEVVHSIRSAHDSAKAFLAKRIRVLAEQFGGKTETGNSYPGWAYDADSALLSLMKEVCRDLSGRDAVVTVTHGGLECGILKAGVPGMEAVSVGPDEKDVHTVDERLSVSSAARTYAYLLAVLARL